MTVKELYNDFLQQLQMIYSKGEALLIRDIIFKWADNIRRSDILMSPDKGMDPGKTAIIQNALKELLTSKPVQYITGEAWFYKLQFTVTPAVLIPRPETEELVEEVISFCKQHPVSAIIDIGTGSGCIPVTLKLNLPATNVTAIDVSGAALEVAKQNAEIHHTPINFIEMDFLHENNWNKLELFDVIVSNPPYIPSAEEKIMDNNVTLFEPHVALFVPTESPYIFYEKIAGFAKQHLHTNGRIFMETHKDHAVQISELFQHAGFAAVTKKDISGYDRMVIATHSR